MQRAAALLLLLPGVGGGGISSRPLHSNITSQGTWICQQGYYRTPSSSSPTCRRCSNLSQSDCQPAQAFVECTALTNAQCVACPPLPPPIAYAPGFFDCLVVRCADQYFNNLSGLVMTDNMRRLGCVPCPKGSYCVNGSQTPCGANLTTMEGAASSPLQCLPEVPSAGLQIEIDLFFTVKTSVAAPCPFLYQVLMSWLQYGGMLGCQLGSANNYSSSTGEVQCVVIAPAPYSALYMQWLLATLETQQAWMSSFLGACLQRPDLAITFISVLPSLSAVPDLQEGNLSTMLLPAPALTYEPRRWGQAPEDVVTLLGSITLLSFTMCLSSCMILGGLMIQFLTS